MKHFKKYNAAAALIDASKEYSIEEAAALIKKTSTTKFDSTIDISFALNVDPTKADQLIRGTLALPHGNGKTKKILAITNNKQEEAKAAGADFVGAKDMLEKILNENWFGFDVMVATPDMMGELGKMGMGRILGPKGLMPNPKTGTVTMDLATAISEIKRGKIAYRVDRDGNLNISIARCSFEEGKIIDNLNTVTETIAKSRPSTVKGKFIKSCVLHTTMGPGMKLTFASKN
ncbi:MAG: 50S ribosomal protein L1 [Bacilli bacterium]|nr:50S ribosomal protein L1 [Bacilli bacterium]